MCSFNRKRQILAGKPKLQKRTPRNEIVGSDETEQGPDKEDNKASRKTFGKTTLKLHDLQWDRSQNRQ